MKFKNLIPWNGGNTAPAMREDSPPLVRFQRELNHLFDDFFGGSLSGWANGGMDVNPRVDISETENEVVVSAELPGMDEKDIDVTLAAGTLLIKGVKKSEQEDKGKNYYRMERSYGSFQRSIPLPVEVDSTQVEATFDKGVLKVRLPKSADARNLQKISVKSAP